MGKIVNILLSMKSLLFTVALFGGMLSAIAGDIMPDHPETPLFQIFEPIMMKADHPKATWDDKHPLLTVFSVCDLILAKDQKGVLLGLNEKDTKAFAALTKKYTNRFLILKTSGDAVEFMHITAPIIDGYIGFKYSESESVAEYFRRRFHIAEFKETAH